MSEKLVTIRRSYLVLPETTKNLTKEYAKYQKDYKLNVETFYDTKGSSLSHTECILMKDSSSGNFWKFFCYALNNIFEITTDEKEINEPLTRCLQTTKHENISIKELKPFFSIRNECYKYSMPGQLELRLTVTDYGYASCTVERIGVHKGQLAAAVEDIDMLAAQLDLKNLSQYEPKNYL